jgi:hypothetical protein
METMTEQTAAGVTPQVESYKKLLRHIFDENLIGASSQGQWSTALNGGAARNPDKNQNIWRSAWAFDTLIDYLNTMKRIDPAYEPPTMFGQSFLDFSLAHALNPLSGNWWDDFGWMGIACLRAAEELDGITDEQRATLLQNGVNSWAYMYGNGWKKGSKPMPWGNFEVPYPNVWGKPHPENIGAPNVYAYAADKKTPGGYDKFMPRFSQGGIWNSDFNGGLPQQSPNYNPVGGVLSPIQNTVTNGVYTILALRAYQALSNPAYKHIFTNTDLDINVVRTAWNDQLTWWYSWFREVSAEQSMMINMPNAQSLVRERPSTFVVNKGKPDQFFPYDTSFFRGLAWTGDQGLLMGVLKEAQATYTRNGLQPPAWLDAYANILRGVNGWLFPYGDGKGMLAGQLRPWIELGIPDAFRRFANGDDPDYQTGPAVFLRYALQLQDSDPNLVGVLKDKIFTAANRLCDPSFPAPSGQVQYVCDGMIFQQTNDSPDRVEFNKLTPWINRLALLILAIRLAEK